MSLKIYLVYPFQSEDLPRFRRRRRFDAEFPGDADDLGHLLRIAFRQLPLFEIEVIFQADPGVSAHHQGGRTKAELCLAGGANGKLKIADGLAGALQ